MNKLKILIIGGGGAREYAIGWKLVQSKRVGQLYFATGNAGTSRLGINVSVEPTNITAMLEFAKKEKIDLSLAISDDVLASGLVDEFKKAGLRIWGPTKAAAEIEWSKAFAKDFMRRHGLPTARFKTFSNFDDAKSYTSRHPLPIVIKASGLALGKGVIICESYNEAYEALQNILVNKVFGDAGNEVVIEEFLTGPEISIHALSDGKSYKMFPSSQDHKRVGEGDVGLNTGGMGVIGPLPFINQTIMDIIEKEIVAPTLQAMSDDGIPFEGILYPSLMLTHDGPKIIEFNSRFGDPEAEVYMRLLDTDLLDIFEACVDKKLNEQGIQWKPLFACNIALASGGYPEAYEKGKEIKGIDEAEMRPDVVVFHAGTTMKDNKLVTNGGRVLGVSATAATLEESLKKAYKAIEKISFEGMQYRKDIGKKALALGKT